MNSLLLLAVLGAPGALGAKVLTVLTSHDTLGRKHGEQTGWYLPEAAHPFRVFEKAGVRMHWASPEGGRAPVDEGSVKVFKDDKVSQHFLNNEEASKAWKHTKKLSEVDPKNYDAVFVVGGYGVMWDLVENKHLEHIVAKIWKEGGVVSGVCHGPAALAQVALEDGSPLVKGKKVACFSNEEEDVLKRRDLVPETCEDAFNHAGAHYTQGKAWGEHVAVAGHGRLVTGQNPASAKATAEAVVRALETRPSKKFDLEIPSMSSRSGHVAAFATCGGLAALALVGVRVLARKRQAERDMGELVNGDDIELVE